jgi:hypothetical protein
MRLTSLLVALMLTWAMAGSADGSTEPPTADDDAQLGRFLPLARAAWPTSPCAGHEAVHLGADARLADEGSLLTPPHTFDGMAAPATCEAWLASGLSAVRFCIVLVHELGHLAGSPHTDVPGDVMNGDGDIDYAPCDEAVTPPARVATEDALRSALPPPRAAWRLSCGPQRHHERRCSAQRGEAVRRFYVTQTRDSVSVVRDD